MKILVILRGYPGSGKTTVGKALERGGTGKFIDHNSILNFVTSITSNDDGIYNEIHSLEKAMAKKLLKDGNTVIVARGFSNHKSISSYVEIAREAKSSHVVIRLSVPTATLENRVESQDRKKDFNPTTTADALQKWIASNRLEDYDGEYIVDASEEVDDVALSINKILEQIK